MVYKLEFSNSRLCRSVARGKVPTYLFLLFCDCMWLPIFSMSDRLSRRLRTARNFASIVDCKPILELSPKYLEVLFLNFYFLRYFFTLLVFLKLFGISYIFIWCKNLMI